VAGYAPLMVASLLSDLYSSNRSFHLSWGLVALSSGSGFGGSLMTKDNTAPGAQGSPDAAPALHPLAAPLMRPSPPHYVHAFSVFG
jgi:hypothetical protein